MKLLCYNKRTSLKWYFMDTFISDIDILKNTAHHTWKLSSLPLPGHCSGGEWHHQRYQLAENIEDSAKSVDLQKTPGCFSTNQISINQSATLWWFNIAMDMFNGHVGWKVYQRDMALQGIPNRLSKWGIFFWVVLGLWVYDIG